MNAILFSLAACVGWGVADFLGGWNCRKLPTLTVLVLSTWFGLATIGLIVLVRWAPPPADWRLLWAVLGGGLGITAMFLLYKAMAVGEMSIISPISSAGVVIPVTAGLLMGDSISAWQGAGMALAGVGAVLASREKAGPAGERRLAKGVKLAVGSAVAIGLFFTVMDRASAADPYYASLLMRTSYGAFLLLLYTFFRPNLTVARWDWPGIVSMGIIDSLASFFFVLAASVGMLSIVSVIAAVYPAVTVALSLAVLRERPQPVQWVGIVLAMVGVALIAGA